jgi:hypothetical protein
MKTKTLSAIIIMFVICIFTTTVYADLFGELKWGMTTQELRNIGVDPENVSQNGDVTIISNNTAQDKIEEHFTKSNTFIFYKNQLAYIMSYYEKEALEDIYRILLSDYGKETKSKHLTDPKGNYIGTVKRWELKQTSVELVATPHDNTILLLISHNELSKNLWK